ncbi:porphobilinogen synthase [bacterium]|nr:porphobilinogen synthase [bacterium]
MNRNFSRFHRIRKNQAIRSALSETHFDPSQFILPIFVSEKLAKPHAVKSMPGVFQHSVDSATLEAESALKAGIKTILLFGIPNQKDPQGSYAWNPQGGVQRAIRNIKRELPELTIMADCCLCEYTSHGHCGIMTTNGLDNDATLDVLKKIAFSYGSAGVDFVAPSGMMDGMVLTIRESLNQAGFNGVGIMSYSAKYASSLYGPFRDAAGSGGNFLGDRNHHQMNPGQRREALLEAAADIQEGADIIMVKPGMFYLDVIRDLRNEFRQPIAAYQVSGEYTMLKLAAANGLADERKLLHEAFTAYRRAGADLIISYAAKQVLRLSE